MLPIRYVSGNDDLRHDNLTETNESNLRHCNMNIHLILSKQSTIFSIFQIITACYFKIDVNSYIFYTRKLSYKQYFFEL